MTKPTNIYIIGFAVADLAHPVERHLAKVKVASSSLVIRSINKERRSLVLLLFLFFGCGIRDSKRPLRSKEQSGGLFVGRVRVGERKSEPSESRNPLHNKRRRSLVLLLFLFFGCGIRDSKRPLFSLQYKNSPQIITVCGVIFMPNYFLGTILSLPPIYIRSASGIETVPSALRLFSRNAISILGGATTVLLRV